MDGGGSRGQCETVWLARTTSRNVHLRSRLHRRPDITEVVEEFAQVLVSLVLKSIHGAGGATHRLGNL